MKIETKKMIFFGSTVIMGAIMFVLIANWFLNMFIGGCGEEYAIFGSYKLYAYLNDGIMVLLPLCFIPLSIFFLFYARRFLTPHDRMTQIGIDVHRFFLWAIIPMFILTTIMSARLCPA
jgi:hypothetical protein